MPRSKSSHRWLNEHSNDPYVKQAQQAGYRSRAAYKLLEIQKKDLFLKPNMVVVDLGAAPGSWCQVVRDEIGLKGLIFALDILPMTPINDVHFIEGDFTEEAVLQQLLDALAERPVDVVISDMAPNMSGQKITDQARAMYLVELAFDFAQQVLKPEGSYLVKVFQGEGFEQYLQLLKQHFKSVRVRKPKASRPRSNEVYLLGTGFLK